MNPERRDLVITLAYRYRWEDLAIFVNSLQSTGFSGDLVMFTAGIDRRTLNELRQRGVKVKKIFLPLFHLHNLFILPGWMPFRWLFGSLPGFKWKRNLGKFAFSIMCARFAHFHAYIERHRGDYNRVAITDVRDVLFQQQPFENLSDLRVVSFLEDRPISGSNANRRWVIEAYGLEGSAHLMDKTVICAGVTLGTEDAMLEYLTCMLKGMFTVKKMHPVNGTDQAVHNDVFYRKLVPGGALLENGNPICMTMGPGDSYQLDHNSHIVSNGKLVSILHQYDRFPDLAQIACERHLG